MASSSLTFPPSSGKKGGKRCRSTNFPLREEKALSEIDGDKESRCLTSVIVDDADRQSRGEQENCRNVQFMSEDATAVEANSWTQSTGDGTQLCTFRVVVETQVDGEHVEGFGIESVTREEEEAGPRRGGDDDDDDDDEDEDEDEDDEDCKALV